MSYYLKRLVILRVPWLVGQGAGTHTLHFLVLADLLMLKVSCHSALSVVIGVLRKVTFSLYRIISIG